jgi:hypothetical protein
VGDIFNTPGENLAGVGELKLLVEFVDVKLLTGGDWCFWGVDHTRL